MSHRSPTRLSVSCQPRVPVPGFFLVRHPNVDSQGAFPRLFGLASHRCRARIFLPASGVLSDGPPCHLPPPLWNRVFPFRKSLPLPQFRFVFYIDLDRTGRSVTGDVAVRSLLVFSPPQKFARHGRVLIFEALFGPPHPISPPIGSGVVFGLVFFFFFWPFPFCFLNV